MEINGENSFKSKTYSIAAYKIEQLTVELQTLSADKIFSINCIGEAIGKKIIINYESTIGSSTKNIVQLFPSVSNHIFPFSFSTIPLHIAKPQAVPDVFVVKLGIKILLYISVGIPFPLSFTDTNTRFPASLLFISIIAFLFRNRLHCILKKVCKQPVDLGFISFNYIFLPDIN